MKKLVIVLMMLVVVFSFSSFAACGKKHESDGKYHSDEAYHWTGCKACKNHTYNKSVHEFTQDGDGKKCKICGYTVEPSDEENFTDFYRAYVNSIGYNGDYTYKEIYEKTDSFIKKTDFKSLEYETRSGDKYLYRRENTNIFGDDVDNIVTFVTINAVKSVDVDGNLRLKQIFLNTDPSGAMASRGVLKKPSFTVDTIAMHSPNEWFREFLISTTVNTYDEFVAAFTAAYTTSIYVRDNTELSQITLARNEDGTLSFRFTSTCVYVDESYFIQGIDTYKNTKDVCSYEIVADENHIVKMNIENVYAVNYTDETLTTLSTNNIFYGYAFDDAEYDKISTDTDTTDDEYVSTINFYVNGYLYAYSMENLKIGSTVTLDEVKQYLADIGENGSKPLFNQDVDPDMFAIYTDKDKTQAFTSLVINEESYTLYSEIVVPEGKAVVMALREYGDVRGIDLCYLKNVGGVFRTSILGDTYPLIEVDGKAITDGSMPEITCDESRVYVVVCKVR